MQFTGNKLVARVKTWLLLGRTAVYELILNFWYTHLESGVYRLCTFIYLKVMYSIVGNDQNVFLSNSGSLLMNEFSSDEIIFIACRFQNADIYKCHKMLEEA